MPIIELVALVCVRNPTWSPNTVPSPAAEGAVGAQAAASELRTRNFVRGHGYGSPAVSCRQGRELTKQELRQL